MIIHELLKQGELGYVRVSKGDFSLTLQKYEKTGRGV
jgi:hypothetical protein